MTAPHLTEQRGTGRIQPNPERDRQHHRREHDQAQQRPGQVHGTLDPGLDAWSMWCACEPPGSQRERRSQRPLSPQNRLMVEA
jgi:hypothetical protein